VSWTFNVVTRDESKQSSGPHIARVKALPSPPSPFQAKAYMMLQHGMPAAGINSSTLSLSST